MEIRFVPDPEQQSEEQPQEWPGDVQISFVPDTAVMSNVDARHVDPNDDGTTEDDDLKLDKEEKREILRLSQDLLRVGRIPAKQIYTQRKIGNKTLHTVRYKNAVKYMLQKSKTNITSTDKCKLWLETGQIHNVAASTTSSFGTRQYWTDIQGELVKKATPHLPYSAKASVIFGAVCADQACRDHHITDIITRQQIRDKFKNLSKKEAIVVNIFLYLFIRGLGCNIYIA